MQVDDQFFQSIGFGDATEEERAELIVKLAELVQSRMALKLSELLTESQLEQFDELLESSNDDLAIAYVQEVYPGYDELLQSEVDQAKQELTQDVATAAAQIESQGPAAEDPTQ